MKNTSTIFIGVMLFINTLSHAQPGSLDGDFDADGKVTTAKGSGKAVAIQPDGKIIVAGFSEIDRDLDFAIVRYHIDGTLDNSFGVDGIATLDSGNKNDVVSSVVIQPDGKILVAGVEGSGSNSADVNFAIARYNTDGVLDISFSVDGIVTTDFAGEYDEAYEVLVQSDGKIVAVGISIMNSEAHFAVVRYNTDGTLDHTFGVAGKVTTTKGSCKAVAIQPDGKIIVAGSSNNETDSDFTVLRYNTDGSLDNSFSVDGIVTTDFESGNDQGLSVVLQPDGRIVVAGRSEKIRFSSEYEFALVRYNTDGTLDNNFSVDGKVKTDIGVNFSDEAESVVLQPDGKILVAGTAGMEDNNLKYKGAFAVVRYNSDGTLDNTFGPGGKVTTLFGASARGMGCAIQPNGRIVVAGYAANNFAVARYLSGLNVGVVDFSIQDHQLLIYPNPLQEDALIEYTLTNDQIININLYDISGRLVQSIVKLEARVKGSHKEKLSLDASIPSGSYILTINNGEGSSSVRVVK